MGGRRMGFKGKAVGIGIGVVLVALLVGGGVSSGASGGEGSDAAGISSLSGPFAVLPPLSPEPERGWAWALWRAAKRGDLEALREIGRRGGSPLWAPGEKRSPASRALVRVLSGRWAPKGDLLPPEGELRSLLYELQRGKDPDEGLPEEWSEEFLRPLPSPEATARWKDEALAVLLPLLSRPDPDIRRRTAAALGDLRDKRAVPELIRRVRVEREGPVLEEVIGALGTIGDRRAVPVLIDFLGHPECSLELFGPSLCIPAAAAEALGRIGDPRAVEPLIALLDHPEALVEVAAIQALGRIGDLRALEPLLQRVAQGVRGGFFLPSTLFATAEALADLGPRALPRLLRALEEESLEVRAVAALALGLLRSAEAAPALGEALQGSGSKDPAAPAYAAALGWLSDPRAIPLLRRALEEEDRDLVVAAAEALGALGAVEAVPDLVRAMIAVPAPWLQDRICQALRDLGPPAVPAILEALPGTETALEQAEGERRRRRSVRRCLIRSLGAIGDPRAVPALAGILTEDPHPEDREEAARALGDFPDEQTLSTLLRSLRADPAGTVRAAAARALGRQGNPEAVPALVEALADPLCVSPEDDPSGRLCVPAAAAEALGRIGDRRAVPALVEALGHSHPRVRQAAAEALGAIGDPEAVPALIEALREPTRYQRVREAVSEALERIGPPAVPALIEALREHPHFLVRRASALILGRIGDPRAVEPLLRALEDPSRQVRVRAVIALGYLGDPRAVPSLLPLAIQDPWDVLRLRAVQALGRIADPRAVETLIAALRHGTCPDRFPRVCVRAAAAEALGAIGDPRALPDLVAALREDPDWTVQAEAATALGKLGRPEAIPALIEALYSEFFWGAVPGAAADALVALGPASLPALLEVAQDDHTVARSWAVRALGRLGDRRAVPVLLERLADPEPRIRRMAAEALGTIKAPEAVPALVRALEDPDVAEAAAEALVQLGPVVVPSVLPLLGHPDAWVREGAAFVLGGVRAEEAVLPLLERLADEERRVREVAAWALGAIGDPRAVDPLMERLDRSVNADPNWLFYGLALGLIGPPAVPVLLEALGDETPEVRGIAALVLGTIPSAAFVAGPALIATLEDRAASVRAAAAVALGALRVEEAVPALLVRAREDRDADVRIRAVRALGRIGSPEAIPLLRALFRGEDLCSETPESLFGDPPCLRAEAALALGRVGDAEAVPDLITALEDTEGESDSMRANAATALGLLGDRRATVPLINAAWNDPDDGVRRAAAFALADLGDPDATAPLWQLAVDPRSPTRDYATIALLRVDLRLGISAFVRYLETILVDSPDPLLGALRLVLFLFLVQEYGLDALRADPAGTAAALAEALRNPDPLRATLAFFVLALLPDGFLARAEAQPLHDELIALLHGPEPLFQSFSALFLGRIAAYAGYPVLLDLAERLPDRLRRLMTAPLPEVRIDAATALHLLARRAEQLREAIPQLAPRSP